MNYDQRIRPFARRKRRIVIAGLLAAGVLSCHATISFQKIDGLSGAGILRVAVSGSSDGFMACASDNTLYLRYSRNAPIQKSAVFKDEQIYDLCIRNTQQPELLVAASRNAYRVTDSVRRIYSAHDDESIRCIASHESILFIGTTKGLFFAEENLQNWQPLPGLRNQSIHSLCPAGKNLYIAADSGVYRYRPGGVPERLFISRGKTTGEGIIPRQVKVDVMTPSMLWLCTSRGVYRSTNRGESWQKFHVEGADLFEARCLVQFPLDAHHFYLVSEAGLFKVNIPENKTASLYAGLPTANIHWADIDAEGKLYVACDQGLFHQENKTPQSAAQPLGLQALLAGEPSITQVQEAAMRYNSVHPDKTADWRKRIKYRALMPKLSVDYDKTIGSSFTSSGYYYAEGPNDWGVSLTWDMGNLIWNSYEDDIDNRTKLTTQLRMDILDEINRLYFERLRLKHEIATGNADNEDTTLSQLRLYELTATLDGYTGGLYSRK